LDILFQLPGVTHDYHSLQTDVMHYDGKSAAIYVTGLLRDEPPITKNSHGNRPDIGGVLLGFSRKFIVKFDEEGLVSEEKKVPSRTFVELFNIPGLG